MDANQLHILQHSLGLDEYGRGAFYRNHFVTGEGSADHANCLALVEVGYMGVRKRHPLAGGDDAFWATEAGKRAAREHSPSPPKLTRGQQRYQAWLDYDGSMSFIEYLKWKSQEQRQLGAA